MILPLACFVGGLVAMGRTKPQTAVRKLICLGPRSGLVYPVEDFPEIGVLVVRSPGKSGAVAQFVRAASREPGKPGLIYQSGQGDERLLEVIRKDFGVEPKLAVVKPIDGKEAAPAPAAAPVAPQKPMPAPGWGSV